MESVPASAHQQRFVPPVNGGHSVPSVKQLSAEAFYTCLKIAGHVLVIFAWLALTFAGAWEEKVPASQVPPASPETYELLNRVRREFIGNPRFKDEVLELAITDQIPDKQIFHRILGVYEGASQREVKMAYMQLAKVIHPDQATRRGFDSSLAEAAFKIVDQAYRAADQLF